MGCVFTADESLRSFVSHSIISSSVFDRKDSTNTI